LAGGWRLFQVDHIITALTPPRTYYPPEEAPLLLGPSKGCTEAIKCLEEHIRLLQGNVNREVLEVFEGEVGVRLIGYQSNSSSFRLWLTVHFLEYRILQKQIKRQIISLNGGFQVIADLNAYHTFISSLKVNSAFISHSFSLF
jgi:recyclin-1